MRYTGPMTEEAGKAELTRRMAEYRAEFSNSMTLAAGILAGIILRDDMKIPETCWQRLGLSDGESQIDRIKRRK